MNIITNLMMFFGSIYWTIRGPQYCLNKIAAQIKIAEELGRHDVVNYLRITQNKFINDLKHLRS